MGRPHTFGWAQSWGVSFVACLVLVLAVIPGAFGATISNSNSGSVADLVLQSPERSDNVQPDACTYKSTEYMANPADFFGGALQRPLLQIKRPENGEVLQSTDLEIDLEVQGYTLPSKLHDSRICLGLAAQDGSTMETCFEQGQSTLQFHAQGLVPGASYTLRAVLFERSNALAVSIRSFRVGAVSLSDGGGGPGQQVSIQTAMQVAMAHHTGGLQAEAEQIYRQIIGEHPDHPDALHLLGLVLYQTGDPITAIPYIQRALLHGNATTIENFHNSLGECLRAAGRLQEAMHQYRLALGRKEDFTLAKFNLGLAYQEARDWGAALTLYGEVLQTVRGRAWARGAYQGDPPDQGEAMLLEAQIRQCDLIQAQDLLPQARSCWEEGLRRWPDNAQMRNELGNVHMQLGDLRAALSEYEGARRRGLTLADLNAAVVLELQGQAQDSMDRYQRVLASIRAEGLPDRHVMIKMATVLPRVLSTGEDLHAARSRMESKLDGLLSTGCDWMDNSPPIQHGFSLGFHLAYHGEVNRHIKTKLHRVYSQFCPGLLAGRFLDESHIMHTPGVVAVPSGTVHTELPPSPLRPPTTTPDDARAAPIRVGWVSRFFYKHAVGLLAEGIIAMLPRPKYEVHVFAVKHCAPDEDGADEVSTRIQEHADRWHRLPPDMNLCAEAIRQQQLDVLIYPEVGIDTMSYFLAFARLAPVQAAWWGHPDTTGVPTIDYFIGSSVEVPDAERHYSERLYRMKGLGAYFNRPVLTQEVDPATIRENMQAQLRLPGGFHLYLCPQALFKFHPDFNDMLVEILVRDPLAHLLLLDGRDKHLWSRVFAERAALRLKGEQGHRILFYEVSGEQEMLALYRASDVVLDTYPMGGYITSLQALAMGVPVVTLPSQFLGGRLTYAMYERMGMMSCVAQGPKEYVTLAMQVAHNNQLRAGLSAKINALSYRIFHDAASVQDWDYFLSMAVQTASSITARAQEVQTSQIGPLPQD